MNLFCETNKPLEVLCQGDMEKVRRDPWLQVFHTEVIPSQGGMEGGVGGVEETETNSPSMGSVFLSTTLSLFSFPSKPIFSKLVYTSYHILTSCLSLNHSFQSGFCSHHLIKQSRGS